MFEMPIKFIIIKKEVLVTVRNIYNTGVCVAVLSLATNRITLFLGCRGQWVIRHESREILRIRFMRPRSIRFMVPG